MLRAGMHEHLTSARSDNDKMTPHLSKERRTWRPTVLFLSPAAPASSAAI